MGKKNTNKSLGNHDKSANGFLKKTITALKLHKMLVIVVITSVAVLASSGIAIILLINSNDSANPASICTAQFDTVGGTLIDKYEFACGERVKKPTIAPEKEGFQFIEWSYLNQPFDFDKNIDENIVLVANYRALDETKVVVVSFDSDGGSAVRPIDALIGSTITAPLSPNKNGFIFKGWYLNGEQFDFSNEIKESITLKAKWEKTKDDYQNNSSSSGNKIVSTPNQYKCSASYDARVGEKTVTTDYYDHVNWTFSTGISYSTSDCYITYKSSNNSVATISDSGKIEAINKGTVYIYECINDNATKKEVGCFKGKLIVAPSQFDQDKEKALSFFNSINGYYWYLDGDSYAFLHPTVINWYDHTLVNWDSKYIALSGNSFVTSSNTGIMYQNDDNIHNSFLANPTELGYSIISKYNMRVSGSKLYISIGGKTYSFTKNTSQKTAKVSLSLSSNSVSIDEGSSSYINVKLSPSFLNHNISSMSSNQNVATCYNNDGAANGVIQFICHAFTPGTSVITFKDEIGGNSISLNLTVKDVIIPVASVTLNHDTMTLIRGNSTALAASVAPVDADNKSIKWSSSNESVARFSDGKVTAFGAGTAVITATTIDGGKSASCTVTVINAPLSAKVSIGISTVTSSEGSTRGVNVDVWASGGTETYNYYYIKLYKDGALIGQTTNTSKNSLFVAGHSNGSYYADIEVRDNGGSIFKTTSSTYTVSGY